MKSSLIITLLIISFTVFTIKNKQAVSEQLNHTLQVLHKDASILKESTRSSISQKRSKQKDQKISIEQQELIDQIQALLLNHSLNSQKIFEGNESYILAQLFSGLRSQDIPVLINQLKSEKTPKDNHLKYAISYAAVEYPEETLTLLSSEKELQHLLNGRDYTLAESLSLWAKKDPATALEWFRKNRKNIEKLNQGRAKIHLVKSAAGKDLRQALSLAREFDIKQEKELPNLSRFGSLPIDYEPNLLLQIASEATGNQELSYILEQSRTRLLNPEDIVSQERFQYDLIQGLAKSVSDSGFDEGKEWLAQTNFTSEEGALFMKTLRYSETSNDAEKWISWMSEQNIDEEERRQNLNSYIQQWTEQNHISAGKWLNNISEGPTQNIAIQIYVKTIAPYNQEAAHEWVNQLPEGKLKTNLLEEITED